MYNDSASDANFKLKVENGFLTDDSNQVTVDTTVGGTPVADRRSDHSADDGAGSRRGSSRCNGSHYDNHNCNDNHQRLHRDHNSGHYHSACRSRARNSDGR